MSGYMEGYGVEDERRGRTAKRVAITLVTLLVLGVAGYFFFHDYSEKKLVDRFISQLNEKQFEAAYRTWGCTAERPCRDYSYAKFLEDWGPGKAKGQWAIKDVDGCATGVIVTVGNGPEPAPLWVDRGGTTVGFSPWPECQGKKWRWRQFFHRLS